MWGLWSVGGVRQKGAKAKLRLSLKIENIGRGITVARPKPEKQLVESRKRRKFEQNLDPPE